MLAADFWTKSAQSRQSTLKKKVSSVSAAGMIPENHGFYYTLADIKPTLQTVARPPAKMSVFSG